MMRQPFIWNFMLEVPEAPVPAVEMCWESSEAGMRVSRGDVVVGNKDNLEEVANLGVVVDDVADGSDEAHDALGLEVVRTPYRRRGRRGVTLARSSGSFAFISL